MARSSTLAFVGLVVFGAAAVAAQEVAAPQLASVPQVTIQVRRASGPVTVDGDLSEPAWREAAIVDAWHQTRPAAAELKVRSRAWLTFDDQALYVGFEFDDPDPDAIRAPLTDRDNALTSSDYAGIIIDGINDGKTAQEFLANPRGVQYDAIWSDIAGESLAPNFHYESVAKIHSGGWTLEMRIPFSSVRYLPGANPVWGITLFRNWPRERRYDFMSATQPTSCFICNENQLVGLEGLPSGDSWVVAPYAIARRTDRPQGDQLGAPLVDGDVDSEVGLDLKWNPSPRHTIDLTVQPDFSQVETDEPQIATNQRFALFYPERRPFFLEQVDLFSTPLSAVYTRTVTDPSAGLRATGRFGTNAYTFLVAQDLGGGSVVIPGATSSEVVAQDFESTVVLGRLRHDLGRAAYVSVLITGREIDGGGYNRVLGPDFQWTRGDTDTVTGQFLWSRSETPNRPGLAAEWDGRSLDGTAALLSWSHGAGAWDWSLAARDVDGQFRADNGFVPRVGFRSATGEVGRAWGLGGWVSSLRLFTAGEYALDESDEILTRVVAGGVNFGGLRNFRLGLQARSEEQRVEGRLLGQSQGQLVFRLAPSGTLAQFALRAYAGSAIDFDNAREGDGWGSSVEAVLRSRRHLEIGINAARDVLDIDQQALSGRLFTADIVRLRTVWTFTPRFFVRAIVQLDRTERTPELYSFPVEAKDESVVGSLLLAYKLDWQSVVYLGYGDSRTFLTQTSRRERTSQEIFFKVSYAFRR